MEYPKDELYLISIRNIRDGQYVSYKEVAEDALQFNVPIVCFYFLLNTN